MRTTKLFFLSVGLLYLLYSCTDIQEEQQLLNSIEQVWEQCETSLPEAQARAVGLKDSVWKSSEYVRWKYNLLAIRLRDKNDIIPSSPDSAIRTMSYFASRANHLCLTKGRNDVDKERAYYYVGSAYRDLKDYPRAVHYFLNAVDAAEQCMTADTLIWQNALSQLSNLYILLLNYEEELSTALQSVELARRTGKNRAFYLTDAATAYEHLKDTLHCLRYCDSAYQIIQEEHFPIKYGRTLSYMLACYTKFNRYEKVDTLLQHLLQLPEDKRPHNYELGLAKCHENANNVDSALLHYKNYYDKAGTLSGRYEASAGLQRCYLQKRDLKQATEWGCRLYDTNDSIIAQRAFEETQRARDTYVYYRDEEKERAIKLRDEHIISVSIIAGLALLSIILGMVAYYNIRKKKFMEEIIDKDKKLKVVNEEILWRQNELNNKQQEILTLGNNLDNAEKKIAASKRQLEDAMKNLEQRAKMNRELTRIALMNNATGKENEDNGIIRTEDNKKTNNIIDHFREVATGQQALRPDEWKELMKEIETLYPGFLEKVQGRLKRQLREPLLHTICLMKIGMKPMQIANVMDAKIQTVWNRVKRAEAICGDLLEFTWL